MAVRPSCGTKSFKMSSEFGSIWHDSDFLNHSAPSWALLFDKGPLGLLKNVKYRIFTEYNVVNIAPIIAIAYTAIPVKLNCPYEDSKIKSLL